MIVKNEYVKVRIGEKEHTFKNWIYDDYLALFSKYQKQTYYETGITETIETELAVCAIKVETPLSNYKNASTSEFDIFIPYSNVDITGNERGTSTIYDYSSNLINYAEGIDLTPYDNKKITAIGFCVITEWDDTEPVYTVMACIDTSYFSIYVNASQGLNISRKDTVMSNAYCDGYAYPLHLAPVLKRRSLPDDQYHGAVGRIRAVLYSVGFGTSRGNMNQEFVIGQDASINTLSQFKYSISMNNPVEVPKYPNTNIYPSSERHPVAPKFIATLYPRTNLQPSTSKYPMKSGDVYIIYKYRLYYNILNDINWLDEYYTMSYPHTPEGIFTVTNTIERG